MINIISATRLSKEDFWQKSALGQSLKRIGEDNGLVAHIAYENSKGVPEIYNASINSPENLDILVFIHDDVWIDDYFFCQRILEGLQSFDVIGVAGNRRRIPNQPAWAFIDDKFTWDDKCNLSGRVAHGQGPFGAVSVFGDAPAECELLDDLLLAVRRSSLTDNDVQFDQRFDFHFYDMDFCRIAREKGLRLGTWPICVTHQSGGAFGGQEWRDNFRVYQDKWGS